MLTGISGSKHVCSAATTCSVTASCCWGVSGGPGGAGGSGAGGGGGGVAEVVSSGTRAGLRSMTVSSRASGSRPRGPGLDAGQLGGVGADALHHAGQAVAPAQAQVLAQPQPVEKPFHV